jgi:hypothetical protein
LRRSSRGSGQFDLAGFGRRLLPYDHLAGVYSGPQLGPALRKLFHCQLGRKRRTTSEISVILGGTSEAERCSDCPVSSRRHDAAMALHDLYDPILDGLEFTDCHFRILGLEEMHWTDHFRGEYGYVLPRAVDPQGRWRACQLLRLFGVGKKTTRFVHEGRECRFMAKQHVVDAVERNETRAGDFAGHRLAVIERNDCVPGGMHYQRRNTNLG